jgi:hypothetical protein
VNISAKISSRIEGIVSDKDTGEPIEGAKIILYSGSLSRANIFIRLMQWETATDSKGYYKFEINIPARGKWYLKCSKKGYIPFMPEHYYAYGKNELLPDIYRVFSLNEGLIKHFKIELEKGGTLKGKVFKKEVSGITPFSFVGGFLERKSNPDEDLLEERKSGYEMAHIKADENGEFEIKSILPYDNYYVIFVIENYVNEIVENVRIRKNESEVIEITIDLTNQTGIEGVIKIGENSAEGGRVLLIKDGLSSKITQKDGCVSIPDKNGNYSCQGLNPGIYRMYISTNVGDIEYEKDIIVEIKEGVTKILNIDF